MEKRKKQLNAAIVELRETGRTSLALRFIRALADHRRIWFETKDEPLEFFWLIDVYGIRLITL